MRILSKTGFLFLLLLLFLANACLQPTEKDGFCTKCQSTQNLQNGTCFTKIRGCLIQRSNLCNQCQSGYVLTINICVRQAQFFNITTLNPPPQTIQSQTLKASDITPVLLGGYQELTDFTGDLYKQAEKTLYAEYPLLKAFKIYKVQQQIVNGVNILFYIIDLTKYDLYLSKVYVSFNFQTTIQQIYKNDQSIKKGESPIIQLSSPTPGRWNIFNNINDLRYIQSKNLLLKTYEGLKLYTLQRVQYQIVAGLNFIFFFTQQSLNQSFIARVYKPFYGQGKIINTWGSNPNQISTVLSSQNNNGTKTSGGFQIMSFQDYQKNQFFTAAINRIINYFPTFDSSWIRKVEEQVINGQNFIVYFDEPNTSNSYQIKIYVPINYTEESASIIYLKNKNVIVDLQTLNQVGVPQPPPAEPPLSGNFQTVDPKNYDSQAFTSVKETIRNLFPLFDNTWISKMQSQVVAGTNIKVIFSEPPQSTDVYEIFIFVPLGFTGQSPSISYLKKNGVNVDLNPNVQSDTNNQPIQQQQFPIAGGYQILDPKQYDNDNLASTKKIIKGFFPLFDNSWIKTIKQQVVSGYNFLVEFNLPNTTDVYEIKVSVPLQFTGLSPEVVYIKKNGVDFKPSASVPPPTTIPSNNLTATKIQPIYDYQKDPIFTQLYKYLKTQVNISNIPAITQVQQTKYTNLDPQYWQYKVIYSTLQYAVCRYYPDYNLFEVISYIADKTELYKLSDRLGMGMNDRTQAVLIEKIKSYDLQRFGRIIVREISQIKLKNFRIYKIDGYTAAGHYQITILDKGELFVVKVAELDKGTCFPIRINSAVEYRQQSVIDQIKIFLFSKYSLSGFELTLSQVNSYANKTSQYRLLLTRNDYKKIYILVQQVGQKFVVKKINILENGNYLITDNNTLKSLEDSARKNYASDLANFQRFIAFTNGNGSSVKFASQTILATYISTSQDLYFSKFNTSNECQIKKAGTQDCQKCSNNNLLWKGKCYTKISNCAVQSASICLLCDKFSIPKDNGCLKDCKDVFLY